MGPYAQLAELLLEHLHRHDRSAAWLATRLGVHPSTVSNWLNGNTRPRNLELVVRIADVFGIVERSERHRLFEAAGYVYQAPMDDAASLTSLPPGRSIGGEVQSDPISGAGALDDVGAPQQPDKAEQAVGLRDDPLRLHTRMWPVLFWTVAALLGLLLLLGLSIPLLWEWPVALIGVACVVGGAVGVWIIRTRYERRVQIQRLVHSFERSTRARIGAGALLILGLGLWIGLGLPKIMGRWAYSGVAENGDRFGFALASGDFNGGGHLDLAVGAPSETTLFNAGARSGWVYLFPNNTYDTLVRRGNLGQTGLGFNEADDRFGWALARGDFNGDGVDDLAVGAPGESFFGASNAGYVFVFRGTRYGLTPWTGIDQRRLGTNESGDQFGWSLAVADFNQDGKDDLAVGAPTEQPGIMARSGYVFLFTGRTYGFQHWYGLRQEGLAVDEDGDEFGWALAAGDFDNDGTIDLAVGAPGDHSNMEPRHPLRGLVYLFRCDPVHGPQPWHILDPLTIDPNPNADRFGSALMVGDYDGDGIDDLAVGAPGELPGNRPGRRVAGVAYIFRGDAPDGLALWQQLTLADGDAGREGALFGWSLVSADFDGDGRTDLAVGTPGRQWLPADGKPRSGAVYVYRSNGERLARWYELAEPEIQRDQTDDWFGWSLAQSDLNRDGKAELIVGAPGGPSNLRWVSGTVYPYRFSPSGPVAVQGLRQ